MSTRSGVLNVCRSSHTACHFVSMSVNGYAWLCLMPSSAAGAGVLATQRQVQAPCPRPGLKRAAPARLKTARDRCNDVMHAMEVARNVAFGYSLGRTAGLGIMLLAAHVVCRAVSPQSSTNEPCKQPYAHSAIQCVVVAVTGSCRVACELSVFSRPCGVGRCIRWTSTEWRSGHPALQQCYGCNLLCSVFAFVWAWDDCDVR